jgi:hypothetical protein
VSRTALTAIDERGAVTSLGAVGGAGSSCARLWRRPRPANLKDMRSGRRVSLLLGTALVIMLGALPASAQPKPPAHAAELFRKGLDDMMAGRFDTGCPALGESYRLDPRAGTLFTLAECENKAGHVASAASRYQEYLHLFATLAPDQQEKQRGRELISAQQAAALAPRIPKLTLVLPPDAPPGTVVKRDGIVVEPGALGTATPLDPGEHVISAEAPGKPPYETRFQITPAEQKRVVVELGPPAATTGPAAPPPPAEPPSDGSALRTAGLVVGGVGLAAVVAGAITGGLAVSQNGKAKDNCSGTVCNQDGLDAINRTRPLGNASTALFVVGGAGLAAGVLMFVLAPSAETEANTVAARRFDLKPWFASTEAAGGVAGLEGAW